MVSTGSFLRLPGDDRKDYLRITYHREVATMKWTRKFPLEIEKRIWKVFSLFLFSLFFLYYLFSILKEIIIIRNKRGEGKTFITPG